MTAYQRGLERKAETATLTDEQGALAADRSTSSPQKIAFVALRHSHFRAYFITAMLAMMADNIEHVISYWVIFQKFHSPALGGFAVISHWTPFLLFSVYVGALADRFDCRRIIQAGQMMYMGVSLAWGLLFLTDTIQVWHAVILLIVHGFAGVLWQPSEQLLIHDIVGSEHLASAVRLNATGRQLGILFGPAVGGGLMLLLGPPLGILANVLIYLPLTVWLIAVPYTGHTRQAPQAARGRRVSWRDALAALREVSGNRPILSMVALAGGASFLIGSAFQAQMPEFAHDLGTDKEGLAYSALLAANALGAVMGGVLLEGTGWLLPRVRSAIFCAILWCFAMGAFAVASNYPIALTLLFLAGVFNLAFNSMAQTLVQLLSPVHLRGRLIGLFNMSSSGLRAFSGLTVGVLGSVIGIHWSLGLSSIALFATTAALLAYARPAEGD